MVPLTLRELRVRDFRNLAKVDAAFGPGFNVVAGDNGHGKTNLLEAVYVALTSKSFRVQKPGELVRFDAEAAHVRAVVDEGGIDRVQEVLLRPGQRQVKLDAKRPRSLAEFAVASPVVVFHPGEVALATGPSKERRRLLDRVALYTAPGSLGELESYTRALRERQRALETRGEHARDLDDWEAMVVKHGVLVGEARRRAADRLRDHALKAFSQIASPELVLAIDYVQSAPDDPEAYTATLRARRAVDLRRGSASVGPHKDELALVLDGHTARGVASQGQSRAIVLALKAAEIEVVAEVSGKRPLLLLDDVSSELDRDRTSALFGFLRSHQGQVLLTTTRPELIATEGAPRVDFEMSRGVLVGLLR